VGVLAGCSLGARTLPFSLSNSVLGPCLDPPVMESLSSTPPCPTPRRSNPGTNSAGSPLPAGQTASGGPATARL